MYDVETTIREESRQTNVILQYKLQAAIVSALCSVIQQSQYILHVYYTLYDGKYDSKMTMYQTIFQLQCFVLLNKHQHICNIAKSLLNVVESTTITLSLDQYKPAVRIKLIVYCQQNGQSWLDGVVNSTLFLTICLILYGTTCGQICIYQQVGQFNIMKEHIRTLISATYFPKQKYYFNGHMLIVMITTSF